MIRIDDKTNIKFEYIKHLEGVKMTIINDKDWDFNYILPLEDFAREVENIINSYYGA